MESVWVYLKWMIVVLLWYHFPLITCLFSFKIVILWSGICPCFNLFYNSYVDRLTWTRSRPSLFRSARKGRAAKSTGQHITSRSVHNQRKQPNIVRVYNSSAVSGTEICSVRAYTWTRSSSLGTNGDNDCNTSTRSPWDASDSGPGTSDPAKPSNWFSNRLIITK